MLYVKDLSFCYVPEKKVIRDLSFSLDNAQMIILTGKSGSGKSSFCEIMAKNLKNYSGIIHLFDRNIQDYKDDQYFSQIHFMKQNPQHNFLAINAERDFALWDTSDQKHRFDECLEKYALAQKKQHLLWTLSYGEQKSLYFVYLELIPKPLWILDEPLEGVDSKKKELFIKLCESHIQMGYSILLTSHRCDEYQSLNPTIIHL